MTALDATLSGKAALAFMRMHDKRTKAKQAQATTGARALTLVIARTILQLAGFSLLTVAAYDISFIAGSITAGLCCFIISWLLTGIGATTSATDPAQSTVNSPYRR